MLRVNPTKLVAAVGYLSEKLFHAIFVSNWEKFNCFNFCFSKLKNFICFKFLFPFENMQICFTFPLNWDFIHFNFPCNCEDFPCFNSPEIVKISLFSCSLQLWKFPCFNFPCNCENFNCFNFPAICEISFVSISLRAVKFGLVSISFILRNSNCFILSNLKIAFVSFFSIKLKNCLLLFLFWNCQERTHPSTVQTVNLVKA